MRNWKFAANGWRERAEVYGGNGDPEGAEACDIAARVCEERAKLPTSSEPAPRTFGEIAAVAMLDRILGVASSERSPR